MFFVQNFILAKVGNKYRTLVLNILIDKTVSEPFYIQDKKPKYKQGAGYTHYNLVSIYKHSQYNKTLNV